MGWRGRVGQFATCAVSTAVGVAVVLGVAPVGAPAGAQEAPAPDVPSVVDPEGLLTQAEVWAVTDSVLDAREAAGVEIVLLYVTDLAGRTAIDHAVEKAPPTSDTPRVTLVISARPEIGIEMLSSPRGVDGEAFATAELAVAVARAEASVNPDLGLVLTSLVFTDNMVRTDELGTAPAEAEADLSGARGVAVGYLVFWGGLVVVFVGLRLVPVPMRSITLADVAPEQAYGLVDDLLYGMAEGRFGFPSGVFLSSYDRSTPPHKLVHDEYVPSGTVLGRVSAWAMRASTYLPGLGFLIALAVLACFWLYLGLWMWLAEQVSKRLLRSRVTSSIAPTEDGRGSVLRVRTRGPSAHLLRSRVRAAFDTPELPRRYRSLVPHHSPAQEALG